MASVFRWACLFFLTLVPVRAAEIPVEAFLSSFDQPRLSPDGNHFVSMERQNGRPAIAIRKSAAPSEKPVIFSSEDWLVTRARWIGNDRLAVLLRKGEAQPNMGGRIQTIGRTYYFYRPEGKDVADA